MTQKITFLQPTLLQLETWRLTDHGRAELQVSYNQIENANRMVDGTMRKQVIATKRTFSTSWENLPGPQWATVDNAFGADDMQDFYRSNVGNSVNLKLQYGQQLHGAADLTDTIVENIEVFFTDFSATISKRGYAKSPTGTMVHPDSAQPTGAGIVGVPVAYYSVSMTLEEV